MKTFLKLIELLNRQKTGIQEIIYLLNYFGIVGGQLQQENQRCSFFDFGRIL